MGRGDRLPLVRYPAVQEDEPLWRGKVGVAGRDDATDDDIKKVCKLANADEFIEKFPEKYNTVVGDRGIRLSGW